MENMDQQLGMEISFKSIMKFTIPSMFLMIFLSVYVMVDGMFVSNFVGEDALAAINIVYPVITITMAVGIMFGSGGSALCAIKLGEGKPKEASEDFTLLIIVGTITGVLITIITIIFIEPIIYGLGSSLKIYEFCYDYLFFTTFFLPFFITQVLFQFLLIGAGEPKKAFILTLIGGCTNIIFDYIFIVPLEMGVMGAAIATGMGSLFATIYGVYAVLVHKKIAIRLVKTKFKKATVYNSCVNGSSEMVTNLATAVTNYLYNIIMMRIAGESGVSAITIILYAQFLLSALYLGYSSGIAPVISFNYGANNKDKLKKIYKISIIFIAISAIIVFAISVIFAKDIVGAFVEEGTYVNEISTIGLRIFSVGFLFQGINIFTSSLFTAFSNGKISAFISSLRTFIFLIGCLIILPNVLGITGVWLAVPIAEGLCVIIAFYLLKKYRKVYNY